MSDIVEQVRALAKGLQQAHVVRFDTVPQLILDAADEIERLRAIVDRLPVTADGVRVTDGMPLFKAMRMHMSGEVRVFDDYSAEMAVADGDYYSPSTADFGEFYSTREAAEAAARERA